MFDVWAIFLFPFRFMQCVRHLLIKPPQGHCERVGQNRASLLNFLFMLYFINDPGWIISSNNYEGANGRARRGWEFGAFGHYLAVVVRIGYD